MKTSKKRARAGRISATAITAGTIAIEKDLATYKARVEELEKHNADLISERERMVNIQSENRRIHAAAIAEKEAAVTKLKEIVAELSAKVAKQAGYITRANEDEVIASLGPTVQPPPPNGFMPKPISRRDVPVEGERRRGVAAAITELGKSLGEPIGKAWFDL